jgi:prepilin-type N-terminal cleavage/methylation domain-containing protein
MTAKKTNQQKGFTIIEIILVIFIVSVGVIGVYTAFSFILILHEDSIDRFEATYLSQEGVEIVRNIRDTNWISNLGSNDVWMQGISDAGCDTGCQADYTTNPATNNGFIPWTTGGNNGIGGTPLLINNTGFYGYDNTNGAKVTPFTRKIVVTQLAGSTNYAAKVTVTTYFPEKPNILDPQGSVESVKVEETLYDWY